MNYLEIIGIDVSKKTIDAHIHVKKVYQQFTNDTKGFKELSNWIKKHTEVSQEQILIGFEHTGIYSYSLSVYLSTQQYPFVMIPGLAIKRSMGIVRGKDDKIDAKRIAQYTYEKREQLTPTQVTSEDLHEIKSLLTYRERLVSQRAGYKASLKEFNDIYPKNKMKTIAKSQKKMIENLDKEIKEVEKNMNELVKKMIV